MSSVSALRPRGAGTGSSSLVLPVLMLLSLPVLIAPVSGAVLNMLLAAGCADNGDVPPGHQIRDALQPSAVESREPAESKCVRGTENAITVERLELEIGFRLIRRADSAAGAGLLHRIGELHRRIPRDSGILLPKAHVRESAKPTLNLQFHDGGDQIWFHGFAIAVLKSRHFHLIHSNLLREIVPAGDLEGIREGPLEHAEQMTGRVSLIELVRRRERRVTYQPGQKPRGQDATAVVVSSLKTRPVLPRVSAVRRPALAVLSLNEIARERIVRSIGTAPLKCLKLPANSEPWALSSKRTELAGAALS